jgi:hypothetical protein
MTDDKVKSLYLSSWAIVQHPAVNVPRVGLRLSRWAHPPARWCRHKVKRAEEWTWCGNECATPTLVWDTWWHAATGRHTAGQTPAYQAASWVFVGTCAEQSTILKPIYVLWINLEFHNVGGHWECFLFMVGILFKVFCLKTWVYHFLDGLYITSLINLLFCFLF